MTSTDLPSSPPGLGELPADQPGVALATAWKAGMDHLFAAEKPGCEIAQDLSLLMDEMIVAAARRSVPENCAVLAIGGYGEGRLAPYSDVDLLLLTPTEEAADDLLPLLHILWDAGINLSHFVHTPQTAIQAAEEDLLARTSFLDARLLHGSEALGTDFLSRLDTLRKGDTAAFIKAKLSEQRARHEEDANSGYAIEPDVKEGRGGLRDIQTLHWLDRYMAGFAKPPSTLFSSEGLLSEKEKQRLRKLNDFLWSVRVHLHRERGRADNTLYFALQDGIARTMGFRASGRVRRVERFMRYYFLVVQEVGRLTRAAMGVIEERAQGSGVIDWPPRVLTDYPRLCLSGHRLTFAPHLPEVDALAILDIFHAVGTQQIAIHPNAFNVIARMTRRLNFRQLRTGVLRRRFVQIIEDSVTLEPVLRLMAETGFLGRMLPSFGAVVGKAEYGLFRQFTLDDHCLRSIAALDALVAGQHQGIEAVPYWKEARRLRAALAMALLLQETASAIANPTPSRIRRRIEVRTGVLFDDPEFGKLVAFGVVKRTLLGRTATRRNVAEPKTLRSVAKEIGTVERLQFLSLFTLCRQKAAGVGSWEEYSHRDIDLLVDLIRLQIEKGLPAVEARLDEQSRKRRDHVADQVGQANMGQFNALLNASGPSFWAFTDDKAAIRLAGVMAEADREGRNGGAATEIDQDGLLNVIVYTDDRPTILTESTGLAAMAGASVFAASGFSFEAGGRRRGVVMLSLNRAGTPPTPFGADAPEVAELTEQFQRVALGQTPVIRVPSPPVGDRRDVFAVTPRIRIEDEESDEALIVEVEARDRPGLLYLLASSLSEIGVDIVFTLVATYGHRAVDTFYLRDYPGYKITEPRRIETIRRHLLRALGDEDVAASLEDIRNKDQH